MAKIDKELKDVLLERAAKFGKDAVFSLSTTDKISLVGNVNDLIKGAREKQITLRDITLIYKVTPRT